MSELQIFLFLLALGVFVIFFKQLFSGNYPKRGVDFEAKLPDSQIGGISEPTKIFKTPEDKKTSRVEELFKIADESLKKGDNIEAKKALSSLLILEPNNLDAKRMLAVAKMNMNNFSGAKELLLEILEQDPKDDLAHTLLANTLHQLREDKEAIIYHQKAIELDSNYAKHYFNYANTLFDLGEKKEALELYKKALELDFRLEEAKKMIKEIENESN